MSKKNPLSAYNKKRDFSKTKEPAGKSKKSSRKKLIFVVHEHHARNLHYDFRLELEGVLKSWAIPKGPSLDPADKRLAVQTEDHPLDYGKFHGTIPKGEYGAGEVFIWDHGTWESEEVDPIAALKKGHLEFSLKGKKLKGKWILIKTHYLESENKNNWLLIKRHDEKKKPKEKLARDPWPDFIPPQLPKLVTEVPTAGGNWIHEMKYDGYRMQAHLKDGIVHFYTRNGHDLSNSFPFLLEKMGKLDVHSAIFDGEMVVEDEKGVGQFQKLQNSLLSKNDAWTRYYIFDLLYLDGKDLRVLPLIERKKILKKVLKGCSHEIVYSEHISEGGEDFYQVACDHKLEGIVSKLADAPYKSGRNELWTKTKCTMRQEFVIGGWSDAKGGRVGFGSLLLGVYEGNNLRYAGRVGTGFNVKTLTTLKRILKQIETDESPFDISSPRGKDIHWVKPERVCEVSFAQWTSEKILRAPVFHGLREDKPAKEIQMERPKKINKHKTKEITSPDKVLFKKEHITKKEVADFYKKIAKHMIPYLAERPLSLVRCPNGSTGNCFYQKHIAGNVPDSFQTFPVKEDNGEGIYFAIDSVEGLLELVQLNAFELHAWNCHKDSYLRPDQIVMDLDPGPGVPWKEVIQAAFELKSIFEDLGLKSFVKLTGGKGIHVHVPIAPLYEWDQVKSFTQSIALEMVSQNPAKYVANMSKKLRKNKIFIDYLRNGYGATAVVPYSLRAKELSAVALPLDWKELRRVKNPQEFTMKKALRKISARRVDPWKGMLKLKQKIKILQPLKKAA